MQHLNPSHLMLMLPIRQSTYLVLTNVLFTSFLIVHIIFGEISLQFQSTNISLLHIYRAHLSLPELYRQCCADLNQHNTVCTILLKADVLNTCGAMICSYKWSNNMFDLNQHNTVCTILVMTSVLNTCGGMICSYFGIVFVLLFKNIENAVYTCFQNTMLLFVNGFIFDIMDIRNNQSIEFEWVPMLAPFRSVNDWRFPWLRNIFVKSSQDWFKSVQ